MSSFDSLPELDVVSEERRRRVAVVGSGIVGLSSAVWLQRAGHTITIIDKMPPLLGNSLEHMSSFGNACTIAFSSCIPIATPKLIRAIPKLMLSSESPFSLVWRDLPRLAPWLVSFFRSSTRQEVERIAATLAQLLRFAEAGHRSLIEEARCEHILRRAGCLYIYKSEGSYQGAQYELSIRRGNGVAARVLTADEIRQREPNLAMPYHKGILYTDSYNLDDPQTYLIGLAKAFRARGGEFVRGEVGALKINEQSVTLHIDGSLIEADVVVVAGGAWSRQLATSVGDKIQLTTERGHHVLFPQSGDLLRGPTCYPEHGFFMTPLREGLRVAGTVELGGLNQPLSKRRIRSMIDAAKQLLPALTEPERAWLGFRPSMPDSMPVLGFSQHSERVVYAFGHGHIGLTLGGITGRIVSDLVSGREPPIDISPFKPGRH